MSIPKENFYSPILLYFTNIQILFHPTRPLPQKTAVLYPIFYPLSTLQASYTQNTASAICQFLFIILFLKTYPFLESPYIQPTANNRVALRLPPAILIQFL